MFIQWFWLINRTVSWSIYIEWIQSKRDFKLFCKQYLLDAQVLADHWNQVFFTPINAQFVWRSNRICFLFSLKVILAFDKRLNPTSEGNIYVHKLQKPRKKRKIEEIWLRSSKTEFRDANEMNHWMLQRKRGFLRN